MGPSLSRKYAGEGLSATGTAPPMTAPGIAPKQRNRMDRFIDGIELLAAIFVGIVAADIFISVLLRKLFSVSIPESYDVGRFLLGILIFWGIAATSYRGTHITVDLIWTAASPRYKRWIDVFATLVLLFVVTTQTIMLFDKVVTTRADHVLPGGVAGRRLGRAAHRRAHLPADLPARGDGRRVPADRRMSGR
jgi:hypothetical protein